MRSASLLSLAYPHIALLLARPLVFVLFATGGCAESHRLDRGDCEESDLVGQWIQTTAISPPATDLVWSREVMSFNGDCTLEKSEFEGRKRSSFGFFHQDGISFTADMDDSEDLRGEILDPLSLRFEQFGWEVTAVRADLTGAGFFNVKPGDEALTFEGAIVRIERDDTVEYHPSIFVTLTEALKPDTRPQLTLTSFRLVAIATVSDGSPEELQEDTATIDIALADLLRAELLPELLFTLPAATVARATDVRLEVGDGNEWWRIGGDLKRAKPLPQ